MKICVRLYSCRYNASGLGGKIMSKMTFHGTLFWPCHLICFPSVYLPPIVRRTLSQFVSLRVTHRGTNEFYKNPAFYSFVNPNQKSCPLESCTFCQNLGLYYPTLSTYRVLSKIFHLQCEHTTEP